MTFLPTHSRSPIPYWIVNKRKIKLFSRKYKKYSILSLKVSRGRYHCSLTVFQQHKIVIPTSLVKQMIEWYHFLLCHPSINRTEETISQHFYWPKMRDQITNNILTRAICQKQKKQVKKYGLLPEKTAEVTPWDRLFVHLIGPYKIKSNVKGVKIPPLKCITMIDPAAGWFEIKQYEDKKSITVANIVEQEWLTPYP